MEENKSRVVVKALNNEDLESPQEMFIFINNHKNTFKCQFCKETIRKGEEYISGRGIGPFCVGCVDFE